MIGASQLIVFDRQVNCLLRILTPVLSKLFIKADEDRNDEHNQIMGVISFSSSPGSFFFGSFPIKTKIDENKMLCQLK